MAQCLQRRLLCRDRERLASLANLPRMPWLWGSAGSRRLGTMTRQAPLQRLWRDVLEAQISQRSELFFCVLCDRSGMQAGGSAMPQNCCGAKEADRRQKVDLIRP